jgi:hypothetical protein
MVAELTRVVKVETALILICTRRVTTVCHRKQTHFRDEFSISLLPYLGLTTLSVVNEFRGIERRHVMEKSLARHVH